VTTARTGRLDARDLARAVAARVGLPGVPVSLALAPDVDSDVDDDALADGR